MYFFQVPGHPFYMSLLIRKYNMLVLRKDYFPILFPHLIVLTYFIERSNYDY